MTSYTDIFGRLDWLTKTVKRLCCSVDKVKEELADNAAKNPCYVEIIWDSLEVIYDNNLDRLDTYNINITYTSEGGTPFTALVTTGTIQRLYGGSDISLDIQLFNNVPGHVVSINDPCGVFKVVASSVFQNNTNLIYANLQGVETLETSCFLNANMLTILNLPNLTTTSQGCLKGCSSLISLDFPLLTIANDESFKLCSGVMNINLPKLESAGQYCFSEIGNYNQVLNLPKLTTAGDYCFDNMQSCLGFNLPLVESIFSYCFRNTLYSNFYNLKSLANLGGTTGLDKVWENLMGRPQVITLTIPQQIMIADGGDPDADVVFLTTNNSVTLNIV